MYSDIVQFFLHTAVSITVIGSKSLMSNRYITSVQHLRQRRRNCMKNVGIRVALVFTFLLMLGVIFVGINFAPPAYAATTSAHLVEPTPPPLPNRVDCGGSPDLIIIADNFTNKDCFRGDGK